MSENTPDPLGPPPTRVVPGGSPDPVTARRGGPDPVRATAPQADAETEEKTTAEEAAEEVLEERRTAVFPVAGTQVGTIPPPVAHP